MYRRTFFLVLVLLGTLTITAQQRETIRLNDGWRFALGHVDMARDYTHGTEYFTYLTKTGFDHNKGPANVKFDDSAWQQVTLPFDWVVDLGFSGEASHSHGYKKVGWKYPESSVGWYRRHLTVPSSDWGKRISVQFDGIFRNSQVFINGHYVGGEPSGYATQVYNLTEYLNYGGDNILTVRADASTEEGWYYEGAGIYRDVWLVKTQPLHVVPFGTFVSFDIAENYQHATAKIETTVRNEKPETCQLVIRQTLKDNRGQVVATAESSATPLAAMASVTVEQQLSVREPRLWSLGQPTLYTLTTEVLADGQVTDSYKTKTGIRSLCFDVQKGILLNGQPIMVKGCDLHQDHAGVGAGIPDGLWLYRVQQLKKYGFNIIRSSHNPATPALLDVCDSLGVLMIDETRLLGTAEHQLDLMRRMMERDRNHPCVMLWSIGNEEWGCEGSETGERIARKMVEEAHSIDPTRLTTYGNSGGYGIVKQVDIHGYNYIVQNDVVNRHRAHPDWFVIGTEETSGCGTRGVYFTDSIKGWMRSINYEGEERTNGEKNVIERGWKFYDENSWAGGPCYWTGFDYRGEPNPMVWPATGSQFGILDYCGFPKDEAFYLKAWWTEEPVLHLLPHWNLRGHEGDSIEVWAYSNCERVELIQDGRSLGIQAMPHNGHLVWKTVYKPGRLIAKGYRNGRLVKKTMVETTGEAVQLTAEVSTTTLRRNGEDVAVIDLALLDKKGRFVPDANEEITVKVNGPAIVLGWGNGDPGFKDIERPQGTDWQQASLRSFSGRAQVIIRSKQGNGAVNVEICLTKGGKPLLLNL